MKRDIHDLIEQAVSQGWQYVGFDGRGHHQLVSPNGDKVSIAATPGDTRTPANMRARLRRYGFRDRPEKKRNEAEMPDSARRVAKALRRVPDLNAHQLAVVLNLPRPQVEAALRWLRAHQDAAT